jgi:phosphate transport system permease protein
VSFHHSRRNVDLMVNKNLKEKLIESLFFLCAVSSVGIIVLIVFVMIRDNFALMDWFLHGFGYVFRTSETKFGIIPYIFTTLYVGVGATAVASIIGIPCAIYLSEFSNRRIRNVIKPSLELLTGLPSIVMGLIGFIVLLPVISRAFNVSPGWGIFAAWILLGIMSLPHVASISEDSMSAVPNELKEASLAMGATNWQTATKVVLPVAKSGVMTAVVLGMGNAIGETMAVMMVIGSTPNPPMDPFALFSASNVIPSLIAGYSRSDSATGNMITALMAAAFILFVMTASLNIAIKLLARRRKTE